MNFKWLSKQDENAIHYCENKSAIISSLVQVARRVGKYFFGQLAKIFIQILNEGNHFKRILFAAPKRKREINICADDESKFNLARR